MYRTRLTLIWSALLAVSIFTSQAHAQVQLANISYEGFRNVRTNGNNSTYGQALTHRYVNGELRFLTLALGGVLHEFRIAGVGLGGTVTQTTGQWDLNPTDGLNNFNGIWFEQAKNRLWLTSAQDYTNVNHQAKVTLISLGSNGTATAIKTFYLNVPAKRVYGGCNAVPAALVSQIGGPYVCGWGGYTSLVAQGGGASIGPTMYAIADPDTVSNGGTMSARTVLDTASSRGLRKTLPVNYFDGGDSRQNPSTRPTSAPLSSAQWLSPNAQGLGWMTWGDSYYNTGMWIGTTYAAVASLCKGSCWYQSSTLAFDGRQFELHLWNGSTLGSDPLRRPSEMTELNLPSGNTSVWGGNSPTGNISGATFDNVTGRIYMFGSPFGDDVYTGRLYSFIVNGAGGAAPPPSSGDSTAPSVSLTSPANGATLSGTVTLTASASDNVGVTGVWFTVDDTTVGSEDTSAPYQTSWNTTTVSNGSHTLRAHARDAAGNVTTSGTLSITVNNVAADTTAPTVALSAPASGANVSGTVTVSASASDNVGVVSVQFQLNGVNLGAADTTAPYSLSWNTTGAGNGTHSLRAIATDAAGNTTTSASRSVTVNNVSSDTTAPTVSLTAPASNATVSNNVTVSASASDNVGVVAVQFTLNGVNLGSPDTSAPFSLTWNTRGAANGDHTLRAVARDAAGNVTTSTARTVRVSNAVPDTTDPTVAFTAPGSSTLSGSVTLAASASDASGIDGVRFLLNGTALSGWDTTAPYSFVWNTTSVPNGTYTLGVIAEDGVGNTRTVTRSVTVNNPVAAPSSPPPATTTCTSVRPAADWVCVSGNWLPPGMSAPAPSAPQQVQPPPPTSSTGCTSVRPGADWSCVSGNWLPPGISAVAPPPVTAPSVPSLPSVPSVCTTIRPAADWVCYDGGWLPPSLYQILAGAGVIQPQPSAPPSTSAPGTCVTPQPGSTWVCRDGGWLPPGHPDR
jgi:hypothetical protein